MQMPKMSIWWSLSRVLSGDLSQGGAIVASTLPRSILLDKGWARTRLAAFQPEFADQKSENHRDTLFPTPFFTQYLLKQRPLVSKQSKHLSLRNSNNVHMEASSHSSSGGSSGQIGSCFWFCLHIARWWRTHWGSFGYHAVTGDTHKSSQKRSFQTPQDLEWASCLAIPCCTVLKNWVWDANSRDTENLAIKHHLWPEKSLSIMYKTES